MRSLARGKGAPSRSLRARGCRRGRKAASEQGCQQGCQRGCQGCQQGCQQGLPTRLCQQGCPRAKAAVAAARALLRPAAACCGLLRPEARPLPAAAVARKAPCGCRGCCAKAAEAAGLRLLPVPRLGGAALLLALLLLVLLLPRRRPGRRLLRLLRIGDGCCCAGHGGGCCCCAGQGAKAAALARSTAGRAPLVARPGRLLSRQPRPLVRGSARAAEPRRRTVRTRG